MTTRPKSNRQVFAVLSEARLDSRDDRIMLASAVLGKEYASFTELSDQDMDDFATALHDWRTVQQARDCTGATTIDALQHLLNLEISEQLRSGLLALCADMGLTFSADEDSTENTTTTHSNIYTEQDI